MPCAANRPKWSVGQPRMKHQQVVQPGEAVGLSAQLAAVISSPDSGVSAVAAEGVLWALVRLAPAR